MKILNWMRRCFFWVAGYRPATAHEVDRLLDLLNTVRHRLDGEYRTLRFEQEESRSILKQLGEKVDDLQISEADIREMIEETVDYDMFEDRVDETVTDSLKRHIQDWGRSL